MHTRRSLGVSPGHVSVGSFHYTSPFQPLKTFSIQPTARIIARNLALAQTRPAPARSLHSHPNAYAHQARTGSQIRAPARAH
ncbi:hypothetical protein FIBSPDRAFT_855739, partial [Athelia psychrophila]